MYLSCRRSTVRFWAMKNSKTHLHNATRLERQWAFETVVVLSVLADTISPENIEHLLLTVEHSVNNMNWFKKETPKEAAKKAKRETQREVRVGSCQVCFIRIQTISCHF